MAEYQKLRGSVTAVCPLTKEETTFDQCYQCQIDHLPHGCWEAEDFTTYLTILIEAELYGAERIGRVRIAQLAKLQIKYEVVKT